VSLEALTKRHAQGWVKEVISDLDSLVKRVREAKNNNEVSFFVKITPSKLNDVTML
jgi:hypothetical protein